MTDLKTERSTHQAVRDRLAIDRDAASHMLDESTWAIAILDYADLIEALLTERDARTGSKLFAEDLSEVEIAADTALNKFGEGR